MTIVKANALFYSCKFNLPNSVKSHRTKSGAKRAAGEYGIVYDTLKDTLYQAHKMSDDRISTFKEGHRHFEKMKFDLRVLLQTDGHIEL